MVQLVARLTAVRGALQDHLEDNPVIYSGVAALLDFTAQICRKLKSTVLGAGSGALQVLLVQVRIFFAGSVNKSHHNPDLNVLTVTSPAARA